MRLRFSLGAAFCCFAALAWFAKASFAGHQERSLQQDESSLIALEQRWLENEHDGRVLEEILATDFIHPVPTGDLLTKSQHIFYSIKSPPTTKSKDRFSDLQVRVYGDVGVVNGVVVTTDTSGRDIRESIFTDVFIFRDGRWQAINAQENRIEQGKS